MFQLNYSVFNCWNMEAVFRRDTLAGIIDLGIENSFKLQQRRWTMDLFSSLWQPSCPYGEIKIYWRIPFENYNSSNSIVWINFYIKIIPADVSNIHSHFLQTFYFFQTLKKMLNQHLIIIKIISNAFSTFYHCFWLDESSTCQHKWLLEFIIFFSLSLNNWTHQQLLCSINYLFNSRSSIIHW